MKSNKKQLIFLSVVVFCGQIVQAKSLKKSKSVAHSQEMLPVASTGGLTLPRFSQVAADQNISSAGLVAIAAPKKFKDDNELKNARTEYTKLTRFKDVKTMGIENVKLAYAKALELGYYEDALFYLKHLTKTLEDKNELQKLACQMADIYFVLGEYAKAAQAYLAYLDMYPGAKDSENALYHYILALNTQRLSPDRDQEITHQVIRYTEKYMLEPTYVAFAGPVKAVHHDCYATLYESEKSVLDFYMKADKWVAAEGRYAYLKQKYYEDFPDKRPEILAYGCDIAKLQSEKAPLEKDKERYKTLYNERLAYLEKQFPTYRLAQSKKSYIKLF